VVDQSKRLGHNLGPPLDDVHTPPWGDGDPYIYMCWSRAHDAVWKNESWNIVRFRLQRAERLGLTYREYTLEILERGRYLQLEDVDRIAEIKARRQHRE
jgi:hypothetical protein